MGKKLLVFLFFVLFFVFSVAQSQAQVQTCTTTGACGGNTRCCVEQPPSANTMGTQQGVCTGPGALESTQYCTGSRPYRAECAYQGQSPDPTQQIACCTGLTSVYASGFAVCQNCSVATYKANGCGCSENSQCSTNYCDVLTPSNLKGSNTCVNKPLPTATPTVAQTNPTPTRTPTPTSTEGGTANGPTPTTSNCNSNGIMAKTYDRTGCFRSSQAKSITFTCNDGTQKTYTSSFGCTDTFRLDSEAQNFCSTHKTCPSPTPTNSPTPTSSPTATPTVLTCDPVKDGVINTADYDLWLKEYTHQVGTTLSACFVPGDNTVNILDFQVWKDINYGLRPANGTVSNQSQTSPTPSPIVNATPTPDPATAQFISLISQNNRAAIKTWASTKTLAQINNSVAYLTPYNIDALAKAILDTNVTGTDKDKVLTAMKKVLSNRSTGFYADIWSYTRINIASNITGYTTSCNTVNLNSGILNASASDLLDTIMHESLHSFNCTNSGPAGALNEGSAIWVFKVAFPEGRNPDELTAGFAETVFGTVNYYRDIGTAGSNFSPLNAVTSSNSKLLELFNWLSTTDGSRLPWNSQTKLDYCYNTYYKSIPRTDSQWFAKAKAASLAMAADAQCRK